MKAYWSWKRFEEISGAQMHQILCERQKVFIVEQECIYQDADRLDTQSWHLMGHDDQGTLVAYARVNFPNTRYAEPSIGRILTNENNRGCGLGYELVQECIKKCEYEYKNTPIRISAQTYLMEFYKSLSFDVVSKAYDEDGIEHVDMVLNLK
ncbi:MAG: GNAT family N-acetyltransferase [Campylobacterota bacterium]|nr:GNAT family N-acetyltransferase [Campylobacterota bacterium]